LLIQGVRGGHTFKDLTLFIQGARKALAARWSTPATLSNMMFGSAGDQSLINPETPSKSLLGTDSSSSMLFSPPSILKVINLLLTSYPAIYIKFKIIIYRAHACGSIRHKISVSDPYQETLIWIRVAPKINPNHGINKSKWFGNVLFT